MDHGKAYSTKESQPPVLPQNSPAGTRHGYMLCILPAVFMFFLFAAHFLRWSQTGLVAVALTTPLLLFSRKRSHLIIVQLLLFCGCFVWIQTGAAMAMHRCALGQPWTRAAIIMGCVSMASLASALLLFARAVRLHHSRAVESAGASAAVFMLIGAIGAFPQIKVHDPVPLLAERFIPGSGWMELFVLALYGGWLVEKLLLARSTDRLRRNAWLAFSIIFFLQAILGISGFSQFLMTGMLHLPVPAMIVAGPVYRGEFSPFMPLLLSITLLLAGPAWCSWFCYFGAWDFAVSRTVKVPGSPLRHPFIIRAGIGVALVSTALLLRTAGVTPFNAALAGILFGSIGVGIVLFFSRKRGIMIHCTGFCPIGLITTIVGKINPFRIKIETSCTDCQACRKSCRYGALSAERIKKRSPGHTCTLCGDCISSCPQNHIGYHFPGLRGGTARTVFLVIVVVIHTVFIGFGRI